MFRCTCAWEGRVAPEGFACWTTVPSVSLPGTKTRLARMPAWLSALTAAASFSPLTSGIVALVGCGGVVDAAVVVGVVALLVVVGVVALLVVVGVVALLVVVVF